MILEEVMQSVLAIAATAMILTLFLRMVAVALKAVADGALFLLLDVPGTNVESIFW